MSMTEVPRPNQVIWLHVCVLTLLKENFNILVEIISDEIFDRLKQQSVII